MKLIRWAGENVTPSDDAKIFRKFIGDGLFTSIVPTYTSGTITIGRFMYGMMCRVEILQPDEETP